MLFYPYPNTYSLFDYDSMFKSLENVKQRHMELTRPRVVKKVETEDEFQIQIFKQYGDFNSYEMRAVKSSQNPEVVSIVIHSGADDFKKVFQFYVDDIKLDEIDWEWFRSENVLVVRVPKRKAVCFDSIELGIPSFFVNSYPLAYRGARSDVAEPARRENTQDERERRIKALRAKKEAEVKARKEAERLARDAEEKARRQAEERARKQAEERARRQAEENARKQAEERARRQAEENARKQAEERARKQAEENARRQAEENTRQQQAKKEREASSKNDSDEYDSFARQQQEFINLLLGSVLSIPQNVVQRQVPTPAESPKPQKQQQSHADFSKTAFSPADHSDNESIMSEAETASHSSEDSEPAKNSTKSAVDDMSALHRHPSLEEVEDEEFTMFKKKFGQ